MTLVVIAWKLPDGFSFILVVHKQRWGEVRHFVKNCVGKIVHQLNISQRTIASNLGI